VKTLRSEGYDGRLFLIGDEPGVPFGRPPLSKTYLRGEESLDGWLVVPPSWYAEHGVDFLRGTIAKIDAAAHRVELRSGESVAYDGLLVATGGRNRTFDVPGADLEGIHQLRTVAESDAIKAAARAGSHAVVVGMGFIGCEVAASLRQLGVNVTAVFPGAAPLDTVLGPEMGAVMTAVHREEGVDLMPRDAVVRFEGNGRVERAVTRGGRRLECDFAVVAVGIRPNVEVLEGTGVAVDNGVLVDETCRTNVPDIYAAGDVANHLHPLFGRVRVEHYNNAEKQGGAAARSMLRPDQRYDYLHTFWSDQYAHKLEYAGHATRWDRFVVRGSLEERRLVGFYIAGGIVRAVVGFDRGGDPELEPESEMAKAARLVATGASPSPEQLQDEDNDLALL
jgi:3-phenylpropionate/trans-cinnamate dioxygenase ferredoxin reductase component